MVLFIKDKWANFTQKHPGVAQFIIFFILSNSITVLQLFLMPTLKEIFGMTNLVDINFQIGQIGRNVNSTPYFIFDYSAGAISAGGGGGLAYFLAVQISLAVAQIINFFLQRKVTFKSNSNIWRAAFWYALAYVVITIIAAALQGIYKEPIYNLFMNTWNMGRRGETIADFITMIINSAISFWVFFPIFKVIFKKE